LILLHLEFNKNQRTKTESNQRRIADFLKFCNLQTKSKRILLCRRCRRNCYLGFLLQIIFPEWFRFPSESTIIVFCLRLAG